VKKKIEDCVVLYVEDDDSTAFLLQIALRLAGLNPLLVRLSDGAAALDFVSKVGPYVDAPEPDLIILDLNLPRVTGLEVLAVIKRSLRLSHIPTYVFTTSTNPKDEARALELGATAFLTKGSSLEAFTQAVKVTFSSLPT